MLIRNYISIVKRIKYFRFKLFLVVIHAILLTILSILLQYVAIAPAQEMSFLKSVAIWKHDIFRLDKKPYKDNVVFIDISKDIKLIADTSAHFDADTPSFAGPEQVITDRSKLAALFKILNAHPGGYKYIICDVLFEDRSADDGLLSKEFKSLQKIIVASRTQDKNKTRDKLFQVPQASATYTAVNESSFLEMPLTDRNASLTIPALLYKNISGKTVEKKIGLTFIDGKLSFGNIIPEFYYRPVDLIRNAQGKENTFYLGELLLLGDDCFAFLKDKYVMIGDFSLRVDVHNTYLGPYPGPLVLWDTFLTLMNKPVVVTWPWALLLFMTYIILSYFLFNHPEQNLDKLADHFKFAPVKNFLIKYLSYLGLFIFIDMISYFFFGTFVSIFYLATYFTVLKIVVENWKIWLTTAKHVGVRLKIMRA